MAKLISGEETSFVRGLYQIVVSIPTSGTVDLEISADGLPLQAMEDGSFSSSTDKIIYLGGCILKATLTGDGNIALNEVKVSKG